MDEDSGSMTISSTAMSGLNELSSTQTESSNNEPSVIPSGVRESFTEKRGKYVDEAEAFDDTATSFSMEHMVHFLQSGSESQQTVVLFEIQQLLQQCFAETVATLVPVLCECIPVRSEALQLSASEAFADIVQQPIPARITKMIADMCFQIIQHTRSEDSCEAWGEILVIVLPDVKWTSDNEIQVILRIVDEFSRTDHESSRKLAARILGSLSASIKTEEVKQSVMLRAMDMVNDEDVEVRGMVAESFSFIGADLELRFTEKTLWPKLLALLSDPDARIHAACIRTIAHILEAKRDEAKTSTVFRKLLPPVFAKECAFARRAASEDQRTVDDDSYLLLEIMAEVFGPFLHALHFFLSDEIKRDAFKAFLAMSTCNGPIVRRYCAFNLPGVALSLHSAFKAELSVICESLGRDPDSETRWNLAAGIHKTCSLLLNKQSMNSLNKTAMTLLQDENPLVRMNALENCHELIKALQVTSEPEKWSTAFISSFFKGLESICRGNWRTQELLAKQLRQIAEFVPPYCLEQKILPLLYQMAEEGTYSVRRETMTAIAKTMWCIPLPERREEVFQKFFRDWGQGSVYWMRIAFVDCAQDALKVFSNDLYSHLFLPSLYQLARDNVPNVRLRVARMLHQLAPFNHNKKDFRETIHWFKEDTDPDVHALMFDIETKIEKKLRNLKTYRKDDEVREEEEAKMEEKAWHGRIDHRQKVSKTKRRATAILPKLATKTGHLSPRQGKSSPILSPLCGSSDYRSPRKSPLKLSSLVSGTHNRSKDSGKSGYSTGDSNVGEPEPGPSPRKSFKHMLAVASPRRSK